MHDQEPQPESKLILISAPEAGPNSNLIGQ